MLLLFFHALFAAVNFSIFINNPSLILQVFYELVFIPGITFVDIV